MSYGWSYDQYDQVGHMIGHDLDRDSLDWSYSQSYKNIGHMMAGYWLYIGYMGGSYVVQINILVIWMVDAS